MSENERQKILAEERERQRMDLSGLFIFLIVAVVCIICVWAGIEAVKLLGAFISYLLSFLL